VTCLVLSLSEFSAPSSRFEMRDIALEMRDSAALRFEMRDIARRIVQKIVGASVMPQHHVLGSVLHAVSDTSV
jgi:coenzyme F420-reducing hydrogenase alpha subunit